MNPRDALSYAAKLMDVNHMEARSDADKLADLVEVREICRRMRDDISDILRAAEQQGQTIPRAHDVALARHGKPWE